MPPKPSITEDDFACLMRRAGLTFGAAQLAEMYGAYAYVEQMAASVRRQRTIDSEPAQVFVVTKEAE